MSSESSKRNATNPAMKAKDDELKQKKKLRKALIYLFTGNGFAERNIPRTKDDEVAVEDIVNSDHYKKQFCEEDFNRAIARDIHDVILKEERHFLLVTSDNDRKVVKYFKNGLEYLGSADDMQLDDKATCQLSPESAAQEDAVNEEEQGELKGNGEMDMKKNSATGGKKKKKNKKKRVAAASRLQADSNKDLPKEGAEENPLPTVTAEKDASADSETVADKASKKKDKQPNNPTDGNAKPQPSKETKAQDKSTESTSESKDQIISDSSETHPDEGKFTPASGKRSSKKKEKQPEASEIRNSGTELKQNKSGKQPAEALGKTEKSSEKSGQQAKEPLEKAGNQTEKSPEKGGNKGKEQKVTESKEKKTEKQKIDSSSKTEKIQKKLTDDVSSTALSSDEERTSASAEGPPSSKKRKKAEDRLKKIPKTFEFLFARDGLKEKEIQVRDDGFVEVKSILEAYESNYNWTKEEVMDALADSKDYIFKEDDADGLLVKSTAEQKSKVVDQPVDKKETANKEPGMDDSWTENSKRKGQDDRRQRPAQNYAAGKSTTLGSMVPEKLRNTLFWILERDGAVQNSVQFHSGKRVYVDELIQKVPALHQVLADEIKAAAEADPRKQFVVDEVSGQMMIRFQENRVPRDKNTDSPGKSDFHLSKTMSYLLRHGADRLQLSIQSDGFMFVEDLLSYKDLRSYREEDVKRVVRENDKQRFLLAEDSQTGRLKVRANQGHTFVVPDLELQPITNASDAPVVVHGTYHQYWKAIEKQGLSRMSRNHIHFAPGEPKADGVISGMRSSCDILIYINLGKALNDGLQFFRSANNVILSPGNDKGIVAPMYFETVVQRSPLLKLTSSHSTS